MIYSIKLAEYILKKSSKDLSNLELQKILYAVEIEYIKNFDKHLIEDNFEAWQYGAVAREVYKEYRNYGANSIDRPEKESLSKSLDEKELKVIDKIIEECNGKTYWQLVEESHKEGGAWQKSFREGKKEIISKDLIKEEANLLKNINQNKEN